VQHIGGPLKKFLKSSGLEKGVAQQNAIDIWGSIVGENVAKNAIPVDVQHGILTVKTETPAWRQELHFQKKIIVENLNKKLNKKIIKDIRFI
jgi:predicted nucleic acid-binding Zn ribbon protein